MNQMLKKASTTCAAFACAASLMFSGAAVVWADGEIDETVKNQIETYAEGLTDEIIGLSDDQIEQYMESDDAFTSSAMTAWDGTKDDLGELKETGALITLDTEKQMDERFWNHLRVQRNILDFLYTLWLDDDRTLVDEFSTIIKDLVEYDFSIVEEQMKERLNIA